MEQDLEAMDPCPSEMREAKDHGIWGITRTGKVVVDAENRPKKFHLTFHWTNTEIGWDLECFAAVLAPG